MKFILAFAILSVVFAVGCGSNYEVRSVKGCGLYEGAEITESSRVLVRVNVGNGTMCAVGTHAVQIPGEVIGPCSATLSSEVQLPSAPVYHLPYFTYSEYKQCQVEFKDDLQYCEDRTGGQFNRSSDYNRETLQH